MRIFCLFVILQSSLLGQKALVLKPHGTDSQDTFIDSLHPDQNFGKSLDLLAMNWQQEGRQGITRMLLNFNLDQLPPNADIQLAALSIYGKISLEYGGNTVTGSANELLIRRVTSPWDDQTVTWNTKPTVTAVNQVEVRSNIFIVEDKLNIDITRLIKDIISDKSGNFGLQLSLKTEVPHKRVVFNASDISDELGRPTLLILYEVPLATDTCISIRPTQSEASSTMVNSLYPDSILYPTSEIATIAEDDDQDNPYIEEAYFTFDYSTLPDKIKVKKVYLTLYGNGTISRHGHSVFSGPNHSTIRRVTQDWNATQMTWNNKPSTTNTNQVSLDKSAVFYQNYTNIDITDLFLDGYDTEEAPYGFHLSLDNKEPFRALRFGSAHHEDPNKRPQLLVCYNPCEDEIEADDSSISTTYYEKDILLPITYTGSIDQYSWSPKVGLSCYDCPNPRLLERTVSNYTLEISNDIGCHMTYDVVMTFKPKPILLPNVISSTNSNEINGIFYLTNEEVTDYHMTIYNRWGNIIYQGQAVANDPTTGWKPQSTLDSGVYVYKIVTGEGQIVIGNVTVVR